MSNAGLKAANEFGNRLPAFASKDEAEQELFAKRDQHLSNLSIRLGRTLNLDYSLDSLKRLEKWYFEHGDAGSESIGQEIGFYLGEVLCKQGGFQWITNEFVFRPGRFEIGVRRGLVSIMLTNGWLPDGRGNKRMQSLYRKAEQYLD